MARGWESKNIESQQEEASNRRPPGTTLTPADQQRLARKGSLELARTRAAADLEKATVPAHRRMLEQAIAALDDQLRSL